MLPLSRVGSKLARDGLNRTDWEARQNLAIRRLSRVSHVRAEGTSHCYKPQSDLLRYLTLNT